MSRSTDPATARLLAVVDSESRSYTDPRATYAAAASHQRVRGMSSTTTARPAGSPARGR